MPNMLATIIFIKKAKILDFKAQRTGDIFP